MTSAPSSPSHADAGPVVDPHQGPDPGPRHHAGRPVRTTRYDPAARPLLVTWEATRACHLACRHCRAEAQPGRDPRELTHVRGLAPDGRVLEVRDDRDDDRKPEQGVLFDLPAKARPLRQERWA